MLFLRRTQSEKTPKKFFSADILASIIVGMTALVLWDIFVRITHLLAYILPSHLLVFKTLITDWNELLASLLITLQITVFAFIAAAIYRLLMAILFTQSK